MPLRQVGCTGRDRELDAGNYKMTNISMDSMIVYDRARLPIVYDVTQPCLVDMDLIFKAFCHTEACLHIAAPLHVYRKQAVSISNGPAAADKFTKMKRILLDRLATNYYDFMEPEVAQEGFSRFLRTSLEAELTYAAQPPNSMHILFEDLIESKL